jgi:hypothetical protein
MRATSAYETIYEVGSATSVSVAGNRPIIRNRGDLWLKHVKEGFRSALVLGEVCSNMKDEGWEHFRFTHMSSDIDAHALTFQKFSINAVSMIQNN